MGRFIDLTGKTFERLTVLGLAPKTSVKVKWLCACSCGNTSVATGTALKSGNTRSCGCLQLDTVTKHGHASGNNKNGRAPVSPEYMSWLAMKARCGDPKATGYEWYGGKGISVCERWRTSFQDFLADMGPRPKGTSIDRLRNNGNYEPGNCKWSTQKEQNDNQGHHERMIEWNGASLSLKEWSVITGLQINTIRGRVLKGWTAERALSTPRMTLEEIGRASCSKRWHLSR